jgi:hypothetical protein
MTTQIKPTIEVTEVITDPTKDLAELAADVMVHHRHNTAASVKLARAIPGLLERIADLEDDVEQLRPREPFVPVTLLRHDDQSLSLEIETECRGGLMFIMDGDDGSYLTVLDRSTSTELTTALSKWAGPGNYAELDNDTRHALDVLGTCGLRYTGCDNCGGLRPGVGFLKGSCPCHGAGTGDGVQWRSLDDPPDDEEVLLTNAEMDYVTYGFVSRPCEWATHWSPLPKPPEVKS